MTRRVSKYLYFLLSTIYSLAVQRLLEFSNVLLLNFLQLTKFACVSYPLA